MDDKVKIGVKYKWHRLTMKDRRKKQRFPELNKGNHCNSAARWKKMKLEDTESNKYKEIH